MMKIGDYNILKYIGKGNFGEVYLSTKEGTKKYFAIKKLKRKDIDKPSIYKYFQNEIEILNELNHPNVCRLEDVKKTKEDYFMVMEYANGGSLSDSLEKYMQKYNASFSEEIVQYLMRQIIEAFKYIHEKQIMHRDIKLENIMLNYNNDNDKKNLNILRSTIKIIDFGMAIKGDLGKTILGTPINMDPLILKKYANCTASKISKEECYDQKIDIWSIGAVCYRMLIGKAIFDANSLNDLVKKVETGSYTVPTTLSREIVSFLNAMLQYRSEFRLSAEELYQHPFLTKNFRDFQKIDTKKVSKKIDHKGLNINIKKNQTIWSIFNENDEQLLLSIKGGSEEEEQLKKPFSVDENNYSLISNNSDISNTHFVPRNADYNSNNNNNFMPSSGHIRGNSLYEEKKGNNNSNINIQNTNMRNVQTIPYPSIHQNMEAQPQFIINNYHNSPPQYGFNGMNNNYYNSPSQFNYNGNNYNNSNNYINYQRQGNNVAFRRNNGYNNNAYDYMNYKNEDNKICAIF